MSHEFFAHCPITAADNPNGRVRDRRLDAPRTGVVGLFGSEGGLTGVWGPRRAAGALRLSAMSTSSSLEEPLLGNRCYAHVRATGRPARRHRCRRRRVAQLAQGRDHRRVRTAVVLRAGGTSPRRPRGGAGGSAGVRPASPPGVAQAALAMPDVSTLVDRTTAVDRVVAVPVDDEGGAVGDAPGWSARPFGGRGRRRSRVRLAHGDGRRDALRDTADRRPCTVRRGHCGRAR